MPWEKLPPSEFGTRQGYPAVLPRRKRAPDSRQLLDHRLGPDAGAQEQEAPMFKAPIVARPRGVSPMIVVLVTSHPKWSLQL